MKLSCIILSNSAISVKKAALAYNFVTESLQKGGHIEISFDGIEDFTSAFANAFIGKLYMNFDPSILNAVLSFVAIDKDSVWYNKIENAIRFGSNENLRNYHQNNLSDLITS